MLSFVWPQFVCFLLCVLAVLSGIGLFMIYFMIASVLHFTPIADPIPIPTIVVLTVLGFFVYYLTNAIKSGFIFSIRKALGGSKTSLAQFFVTAMDNAPHVFLISLLRDLIWGVPVGILGFAYVAALSNIAYMNYIIGFLAMVMIFLVHLLFKPSLIFCSSFGMGPISSLKAGFRMLGFYHIRYVGVFFLYAINFVLNLIPLLGIPTYFIGMPILTGALVAMAEKTPAS
ncbi:hypothetical protein HY990_05430 [Candidatus Micrarchaeota archaeon]|nr:hypothetical protein [Candidatus Micrarchaeota archaeon]